MAQILVGIDLDTSIGLSKHVANTGWLLAERAVKMASLLLLGVLLARYLGPADFGLLSFAMSVAAIYASITTFGIDQLVVRELVKFPGRHSEILGAAFALRFGGSLLLFPVLVLFLVLNKYDGLTMYLVVIVTSGTIFRAFDVIHRWIPEWRLVPTVKVPGLRLGILIRRRTGSRARVE